ncbi:MAG: glycosyltransferase [Lachnospiraceae bacterium]|nr:glycosyltransferase [Lachnospiraceae bacterium]
MGKLNKDNLRKTIYYLKKNGLKNTMYAITERLQKKDTDSYTYVAPEDSVLKAQRERSFEKPVTFSILVPLYHTPKTYFTEMVESVLNQTYPHFQLVLLDAGEEKAQSDTLAELARGYNDNRICYYKLEANKGIAENTNAGLVYATGDYIALLDHDDLLTSDALYEFASAIEDGKKRGVELQLLYSDEDKCDGEAQTFYEPHYKLDFNLDLLMTNNYICHLTAVKAELFKELKLRGEYNGAQDFDLVLRVAGKLLDMQETICHISKILYHWRCHTDSTAANPASKMYAYEAGKRAVEAFVAERGWKAKVDHLKHLGFYRVTYEGDADAIFVQRPKVGALGGSLLGVAGKIVGGLRDADGTPIYEGLRHGFSGYMNRAALVQQAKVLDVRCMKVNSACEEIYLQCLKEFGVCEADAKQLHLPQENIDITELSVRVSEALRAAGYVLVWDPWWEQLYDGFH